MDPALIGSIFAGITGVLTVVTGYLLNRRKVETEHVANDVNELTAKLDDLRARLDAALSHIYELRGVMSARDLPVPAMPDELTARRRRSA